MEASSKPGKRRSWCAAGDVVVGLLVTTMALVQSARAADPLLEEAATFFGQVLQVETGVPGVIVAVVRGQETAVAGFGEVADGSGRAPDGRTVMRLGSITKAFTGQILAGLAADGTVRLADPLGKHLD